MAIAAQDIEPSDHVVCFYDRESELIGAVVPYLAAGAQAAEVSIVVATGPHRRAFEVALEADGLDLELAKADGRLVSLDAAATMGAFMLDGSVDRDAFHAKIVPIVREAVDSGRRLRVYGEMVALLWEAGNVLAAIELERLWNELARELPFSLLCAYRTSSVAGSEHADALYQVCQLHSSVHGSLAKEDRELLRCISDVEVAAELPAERDAPGCARRLVMVALRRWGYDDALVDEAALLVTELASNAVLHAASPFSISVRRAECSTLWIAVEDQAPPAVTARNGGLVPQPMHGLSLIEALACRWGVEATPGGKIVWAELPCEPSVPAD